MTPTKELLGSELKLQKIVTHNTVIKKKFKIIK